MRAALGLIVVLALASCSSEDELGSGNGTCAQRKGSYLTTYTMRSGTCGEGVEVVQNIDKQPTSVDPPCSGSISYTADNCEVTYSSTCPNNGVVAGGVLTITGKSKWNVPGDRGEAVETWSAQDPNGKSLCLGTYDVVVVRQ